MDAIAFAKGERTFRYDGATVRVHVPRDIRLSEVASALARIRKEVK